jgi:diaminopimelate epimerase
MGHAFLKMNGAGNDFVVVAADGAPFTPGAGQARSIADRGKGIGCDQLIAVDRSEIADARMRIWNADGGEVDACGNATRCVAWLMMRASGRKTASVETAAGVLNATSAGEGLVTIDMGPPRLNWHDVPMAWSIDTREVALRFGPGLTSPGCVSMGNPHVVFFLPEVSSTWVDVAGPLIERHWLFPQRANVGFAQIKDEARIRLRVWERGAGRTAACGTGACAALVAANRRGLTSRAATVEMDGGELLIEWRESDDHVLMTGPVAVEFAGHLPTLEPSA